MDQIICVKIIWSDFLIPDHYVQIVCFKNSYMKL